MHTHEDSVHSTPTAINSMANSGLEVCGSDVPLRIDLTYIPSSSLSIPYSRICVINVRGRLGLVLKGLLSQSFLKYINQSIIIYVVYYIGI